MRQGLRRYSDSIVRNFQHRFFVLSVYGNMDFAAGGRVVNRIVDQVYGHLLKTRSIAVDVDPGDRTGDMDFFIVRQYRHLIRHAGNERSQIEMH